MFLFIPKHIIVSFLFVITIIFATQSIASEDSPQPYKICHGFSCQFMSEVELSSKEWRAVRNLFFPIADSAVEERKQIQRAIGLMEVLSGKYTPTYKDVRRNSGSLTDAFDTLEGQLDCVDEAINTTTYLNLFKQFDLLKHHSVADRAYRRALLDQHWAGQLIESKTKMPFIVDSWFGDNGDVPHIVAGEDWFDLSIFGRRNKKQKKRYTTKLVSQR